MFSKAKVLRNGSHFPIFQDWVWFRPDCKCRFCRHDIYFFTREQLMLPKVGSNARMSPTGVLNSSRFSNQWIGFHGKSYRTPPYFMGNAWFPGGFSNQSIVPRRVVQWLSAQDRRKLPMPLHRRERLQHVGRPQTRESTPRFWPNCRWFFWRPLDLLLTDWNYMNIWMYIYNIL